ncbi:polysialyltransferase family glycosyltransferase [Paenibacillus motobuensis]|uniref:Capsular biosynthesis protein n=1 Tax=Paenibacillus motobuensis TaxID=295324 RepID=A0ABN0Y028_9BACL
MGKSYTSIKLNSDRYKEKFRNLIKRTGINISIKIKSVKPKKSGQTKKVVVYHAMTAYHFLECVVDKMKNNKKSTGIFLISKYVSTIYPEYKDLLRKEIFDYILIYDIRELLDANSISSCEQKIIKYFDELFYKTNIAIEECSEIHIMGAHHGFGSYVCMKNKPFFFYEEAAGLLSNFSGITGYEKQRNPINYSVTKSFGLFNGDNDLIIEKRCVLDSQVPDFIDEKARNYEVVSEISNLSKQDTNYLIDFFNAPKNIPFSENNLLVLGQQLFHNGVHLNNADTILTYQLLIDYYSKKQKIIFKPHPADKSEYENYFDNLFVIRTKFPSELLPFLPGANYQEAITINSTAINNLKNHVDNIRSIGYYFMDFKSIIHRCCAAFEIIKMFRVANTKLFHFGINNEQIINFAGSYTESNDYMSRWLPINSIPNNSISIINNIDWDKGDSGKHLLNSMRKMDDTGMLIFINQNNDYCFFDINDIESMNYIVPVVISKKKLKSNTLAKINDEVIYVFCKSEEKRKRIQEMYFEKTLGQTGIKIMVSPISDEKLEYRKLEARIGANEFKLRELLKNDN